jgi:predicted amidohydrolase
VETAGRCGSQLIVFPELSMTGYSFLNKDEAFNVAEPSGNGITARYMRKIAVNYQAYVCWGFVEANNGLLYNAASVAAPNGDVILTVRKMNLWGNDFLWAKPYKEPPGIIQTDLGMMTVLICRDVRDKIPMNIPRVASNEPTMFENKKVDIINVPVNWGKGGFPSTTWLDLAANNQCTVVVANRWGKETNGTFEQDFGQGGSAIIDKNWNVHIDGVKFGDDCVVTAYS